MNGNVIHIFPNLLAAFKNRVTKPKNSSNPSEAAQEEDPPDYTPHTMPSTRYLPDAFTIPIKIRYLEPSPLLATGAIKTARKSHDTIVLSEAMTWRELANVLKEKMARLGVRTSTGGYLGVRAGRDGYFGGRTGASFSSRNREEAVVKENWGEIVRGLSEGKWERLVFVTSD